MKKFLVFFVVFILVGCSSPVEITSFEECVEAGNPVMESYPRQCNTEDGKHFVEELEEPVLPVERNDNPEEEQVFCTADVKECDDGSYVSRQAPDCEFAACPGEEE